MRILSGIGSSFDLALNNPAGMVALVEAVEVYERAAEQYNQLYKDEALEDGAGGGRGGGADDKQRLQFTDMRAAALAQIYEDFELRGLEVFRTIHMQAADTADENGAVASQFSAVLRAARELVAEIDLVKNVIAPCFAPHWAVEVLWSSCVAHVCSNQILQLIGGQEGNNLPELEVTQLLDLLAWVEFFRDTIEETFPKISEMHAKKTYLDTRPDLFAGDKKQVDMESATDSLAWVNNMLWEVHNLSQSEFFNRTRTQTEEWLNNAYEAVLQAVPKWQQNQEGRIITSLCVDVFTLVSVRLRTIQDRLSKKSEVLALTVVIVFNVLRSTQNHRRDSFLQGDLEACCAAANDFTSMSEKCEEMLQNLLDDHAFSENSVMLVEASSSELLAAYSSDAVYAAQYLHIYIFEDIQVSIGDGPFCNEWVDGLTQNDLALTITKTLDDFMGDLVVYIDEFMLKKSVDALVSASVIFYVKCLLLKADKHNSNKQSCFSDNKKALDRISKDIGVMREYFDGLVTDMPALGKVIEHEFEILTTIHELMSIAADVSVSEVSDFILVLHKRVRDVEFTKRCVADLWHLVAPTNERVIWEAMELMEEQLLAVAPHDESLARSARSRSQVPGLRLDVMMYEVFSKGKRKRPVKTSVDKIMANWKQN